MIKIIEKNQIILLINLKIIIMGRITEISTSKIKKIMEIIKNWREKGWRDEVLGSNPHSKGENFSRSRFFFLEIKIEMKIRIKVIEIINIAIIDKDKIIYIILFMDKLFNWKLNILYILYKFY